MAKKKIYAVRNGRNTGIFHTWPECEAQVKGFPGAQFKSFPTETEALSYLSGNGAAPQAGQAPAPQAVTADAPATGKKTAVIYTDGSWHPGRPNDVGAGGVIFINGSKEPMEFSRLYENTDKAAMRNVAGEIMAAVIGMNIAVDSGADKVTVYHDYTGIHDWIDPAGTTGKPWKANTELSRAYVREVQRLRSRGADIQFIHIPGHSGHAWNERADQLANQAFSPDVPHIAGHNDITMLERTMGI